MHEEARTEIRDLDAAGAAVQLCDQHRGVLDIALGRGVEALQVDGELALERRAGRVALRLCWRNSRRRPSSRRAGRRAEQAVENRVSIESLQAGPDHRPLAIDKGAGSAVADDPEIERAHPARLSSSVAISTRSHDHKAVVSARR